jgi:hypothetical protein
MEHGRDLVRQDICTPDDVNIYGAAAFRGKRLCRSLVPFLAHWCGRRLWFERWASNETTPSIVVIFAIMKQLGLPDILLRAAGSGLGGIWNLIAANLYRLASSAG